MQLRPDGGNVPGCLAGESHLWTFVRFEEVEPTNHASERALCQAVEDRKNSDGTDSDRGGRFVERVLAVAATRVAQAVRLLNCDSLLGFCRTRRFVSVKSVQAQPVVNPPVT
jgi:hypothetical protein